LPVAQEDATTNLAQSHYSFVLPKSLYAVHCARSAFFRVLQRFHAARLRVLRSARERQ
jgi:hypothetical protein